MSDRNYENFWNSQISHLLLLLLFLFDLFPVLPKFLNLSLPIQSKDPKYSTPQNSDLRHRSSGRTICRFGQVVPGYMDK